MCRENKAFLIWKSTYKWQLNKSTAFKQLWEPVLRRSFPDCCHVVVVVYISIFQSLPSVHCGSAIYAPRISPRYEVGSVAAPPRTLRCLSETGGALNIGPSGDSRVAVPRCQNKEIQSLASTHSHTVFRVSGLGVTFASLHGSRQGELSAFKHIPHFVPLRGTGQTLLRIIIRIYPHISIYIHV